MLLHKGLLACLRHLFQDKSSVSFYSIQYLFLSHPTAQAHMAGRFAICNEHIRKARQHLTRFRLEDVKGELDGIATNLNGIKRTHETTIQNLQNQLSTAEQNLTIERENSQNLEEQLKSHERKITLRDRTIKDIKQEMKYLRETHDEAITKKLKRQQADFTATKMELYQEGLAKGSWLSNIALTSTSPRNPHLLPLSLKQAIFRDVASSVEKLLVSEPGWARSPALHYAALVGSVEIAEILRKRGLDVNEQCIMSSEDNLGGTVYAITPMHLAIGARNEAMIRYLRKEGGRFEKPKGSEKRNISAGKKKTQHTERKKTIAPIYCLIQERWLRREGSVEDVVNILKLVKDLGWDSKSPLNREGETMGLLARRLLEKREELRDAIRKELQS